jgi:hypothetical protein
MCFPRISKNFCFASQTEITGISGNPTVLILACAYNENKNVLSLVVSLEKPKRTPRNTGNINADFTKTSTIACKIIKERTPPFRSKPYAFASGEINIL